MAGKVRYLINRSGRYHARLVVPKELRRIVGKTELRSPLGGDYRQALKLLPGAVDRLQRQIALAERKAGAGMSEVVPARYPLAPDQIALSHYMQRLAFDDELRNDPRYASSGYVDELLVQSLRDAVAGRAADSELEALVGSQIQRFRAAGNLDAKPGSTEWREIARALCHAELEALARVAERDEGDFTGTPTAPIIKDASPPEEMHEPVQLTKLWDEYVAVRRQAGFMKDGAKRQGAVIENLRRFLKTDDVRRLTKKDLLEWRGHLMQTLKAKTVSDVYLSTIRSLLSWAVENDVLPENVASNVRQAKPRKTFSRERGFTDAEAATVLKISRSYEPNVDEYGTVREAPEMTAAKCWVPIICAFSGARVAEITQLRKEDIREVDGRWVARITPDAGTVKAGGYRDVPLHPQIIEQGFFDFLNSVAPGPLFHTEANPEKFAAKASRVANRLATWVRKSADVPKGVQPNHAWRHRFKTQCRELGISDRVADAIQGHAGRTASDGYGDVTLKTKINAIDQLPAYDLGIQSGSV